jgi:aconitate decarboxylase
MSTPSQGRHAVGLTKDIGRYLADMRFERVPQQAIPIVCTGFTDCVGVLIAGLREPVTAVVARAFGIPLDIPAMARFAGPAVRAPDRALLYGTAAHALDYDDTALSGHPSAVLVPAILAEAEEVGADGPAMIAAYVAGYEVWAELISREQDQHHRKGWHPSAVFGAIAAAGASAVLRQLDPEQASRAAGIAASLAGGVVANFGSMTKPYQVGRAAQSGLIATRLAQAGMTASDDAIEHDLGFLRAISPHGSVDTRSATKLGLDWRIARIGINIKLYPMCYATHRSIDAMLDLCHANRLRDVDIASVDVELGEAQAAMLRNHRPQNGLDAKFSLEFALASAVVAGRCTSAELSDAFVRRPEVQRFFSKVRVSTIAEKDPDDPAFSPFDRLYVALRDGRRLASEAVYHPRGHFRRPIDREGLWRKFQDCAAPVLGADANHIFNVLQNLPRLTSVSGRPPSQSHAAAR